MKPFENWNQKSLVLIGASLGAGVLLLLAAVPSQTDFDGTYFKTNSLPISLTGYLTNWAKLDTNASGGDTIWTTNSDGVISPLGTGQLTNTLRFTSGLPSNATNSAVIITTATNWDNGSLLTLQDQGTNRLKVDWMGGIYSGSFIQGFPDFDGAPDVTVFSVRNISNGDHEQLFYQQKVISTDPVGRASAVIDTFGSDTNAWTDWYSSMTLSVITNNVAAGDITLYCDPVNGSLIQITDHSTYRFRVDPFAYSGEVLYVNSQVPITDNLVTFANSDTNKFEVAYDGSLTTGGNTNRWIFASYDNSKANVTVEGNAHALLSDETPVVNGNLGAALSVGDTTFVNMLKASQTNSIASAMTFSYATNGLDLIEFTHVRTFLNGSGSDQTVNLPSGWHKGQGAGSSFVVTNATLAKLYVTCMGPTSSAALQTNVTATVSFFP